MTQRTVLVITVLLAALLLGGCQDQEATEAGGPRPIFGDGSADNSRVVATVNGYDITEKMVDMRLEEVDSRERHKFEDEDGRRLFVRQMVDEALRVQEARKRELPRDPVVRRGLISQERQALDLALQTELVGSAEPTIDEVRDYFTDHRDQYKRLGVMNALHVQTSSRETADEVYRKATDEGVAFARLVAEYSENRDTKINEGSLGWFNRSGFIPGFRDSKAFTELIWDFDTGVNPPVEFGGSWHVVKVIDRKYERLQTLEEAYDRVVQDMLPEFRRAQVAEWQRAARQEAAIQYFGEYRPGQGKSAAELFERAFYVNDPEAKLDLLGLLVDDYPQSEYADDALFTAANIALDQWSDRRQASYFLSQLLERYPQSEYREDAQYILDHMSDPSFVNPTSIEDLQRRNR
jgi:peptidyl-prolyl cis-trans isomerase C